MGKYLGVHYIYQEKEPLSQPKNLIIESLSVTELLASMPKSWIVNLHEAALDADVELVSQILESTPESHTLLRQTCQDWVKKFQFEKILDLTESLLIL